MEKRRSRITSFVKGLFDKGEDLPLDASLKASIARSLVTRMYQNPDEGVTIVYDLLSKIAELQEQNRILEQSCLTDALTGAHNERYFHREMERLNQCGQMSKRKPTGRHFILMIDLDGFKQINDRYGHACGNMALKHVVTTIRAMIRKSDDICRIGGDEFVIILKNATQEGAYKKILEITDAFETMSFTYENIDVPVRGSIGWTEIDPTAFIKDIMKKIDDYVYETKKIKGDTRFAGLCPSSASAMLEALESNTSHH